ERPDAVRILRAPARMELQRNRIRRVDATVVPAVDLRVVDRVRRRLSLPDVVRDLGWEKIETLMRPDRARRPALDRTETAAQHGIDGLQRFVCRRCRKRVEAPD